MASRDPKDLECGLRTRWELSAAEYARQHPKEPQPFLTQTYRSPEEQNDLYAQGRTKPGKRVTNARGGQSLHNYKPALAFDIAFKQKSGALDWREVHFHRFAAIAKSFGLGWGGDWKGSFKDLPHFDPPGMTWQKAKAGEQPKWEK